MSQRCLLNLDFVTLFYLVCPVVVNIRNIIVCIIFQYAINTFYGIVVICF